MERVENAGAAELGLFDATGAGQNKPRRGGGRFRTGGLVREFGMISFLSIDGAGLKGGRYAHTRSGENR